MENVYGYDLVALYESYFGGNREAGMKINNILRFKTDYGDFTSMDDVLKASDMLRKCETALSMAVVSTPFRSVCQESVTRAYERIEPLWKEFVMFGRQIAV